MVRRRQGALLSSFSIDRASATPVYRQLEEQIRSAILKGDLQRGVRLPSSRILAAELGLARPTVVQVLEALQFEGYLEARQGAGTFVAHDIPKALPTFDLHSTQASVDNIQLAGLSRIGTSIQSVPAGLGAATYAPFLPNFPAFDAFPWANWRKCWTSPGANTASDMGYSDPAGFLPLRRCIAQYLGLQRGDACDPDQIIITSGAHAAFSFAAMLLADPGDKVWLENPGPVAVRNLFKVLGLDVVDIGSDNEGMMVADAIGKAPDARLVFAMPSRQHPLGTTMSLPRRLALLSWAQSRAAWIIEDDYDSEFRYVGRPLASIRSIDTAGRVIYVGTFSKALYPAIRIGYLVLPPQLVGVFRDLSSLVSRSVPVEMQAALARFIDGGHFVTHLRRTRELYAERSAAFLHIARQELGEHVEMSAPTSGMNVLAWLKPGVDDRRIHATAESAGVRSYPLSDYGGGSLARGGLLLGFTGVSAERMREPLARLGDVLDQQALSR
ncbi:PLP-dependent aminotransferase family protein [Rhizobium sp. KVB221]|uniref:PLP-dependent aminotransferase family protein n=1 Tax=Rhizobium setariae TaxID=2801340 RepID=A0A937CR39_9HYPH|nr:PLP-dependent aminotransferase family protein [Rhizobium setariae]MBL0373882.1 PLP-dependent aminotransferase family protein [Rhizobium setariae]